MFKKLLIVLLLLWSSAAWGATYYMRTDGSAANKASATSCSAASTAMDPPVFNSETFSAGDIIILCDGTYTEQIVVPSSGSAGSPITIQGQTKSGAIIDTVAADHSMKAVVKNYITIKDITFTDPASGKSSLRFQRVTNIIVDNCSFSDAGGEGGHGIWFYAANGCNNEDNEIKNSSFSTLAVAAIRVDTIGVGISTCADDGSNIRLTIDNNTFSDVYSFVWFYGTQGNVDPGGTGGENGVSPYGIDIKNNSGADATTAWVRFASGLRTDEANYVRNNTFSDAGESDQSNINGIQAGWVRNLSITDNVFNGVLTSVADGAVIILDRLYSDDNYLSNNVIVARNYIANGLGTGTDGKGLSVYRGANISVYSNVLNGNGIGIKQDGSTSSSNIYYNNTISGSLNDGVYLATGTPSSTWTNNIIVNSAAEGIDDDSANDPVFTYSILWNNTGGNSSGFTHGAGEINSNPQLTSSTNFHLKANSPAIGAGVDLGDTYKLDYDKKDRDRFMPWDIGALEFLTGRRMAPQQ